MLQFQITKNTILVFGGHGNTGDLSDGECYDPENNRFLHYFIILFDESHLKYTPYFFI